MLEQVHISTRIEGDVTVTHGVATYNASVPIKFTLVNGRVRAVWRKVMPSGRSAQGHVIASHWREVRPSATLYKAVVTTITRSPH